MQWESYDPRWLVELAKTQHPDKPWLADALSACTRCQWKGDIYLRFVDARRANRPGAPWQFRQSLFLKDPGEGNLVLDVLVGNRIGGVEFYDRLFGRS